MGATSSDWTDYDRWGTAIASVVYPEDQAGLPVYMDMDDDILEAIAKVAGYEGSDPAGEICAVVKNSLSLQSWDTAVFGRIQYRLRQWRKASQGSIAGGSLDAPPVLPLLAVLTLAAERMGEGQAFAAHAYYPQLHLLLGITDSLIQQRVVAAYRKAAEPLWENLNYWLEALDGTQGTPTAFALSHRYVGLPISQALVREADRKRFPNLFRSFGLSAGMEISPGDMERLLEHWMAQEPCPMSQAFKKSWQQPAAKERIAEVATLELRAWDGTSTSASGASANTEVRLIVGLRRFPVASLETTLSAHFPGTTGATTVTIASAVGASPTLDFEPAPGGWLRSRGLAGVDIGSLLSGLLVLEESETGAQATRRPRPLIPLRKDELLGSFIEVERVQLGENFALLVRDERRLPDRVDEALAQIARPGYARINALSGLPAGWEVFRDVQVMATLTKDLAAELNPLVSIVSAQLSLAEGLKLPGRIRKFSKLQPPEIRAVTQNAETVRILLTSLDGSDNQLQHEWTSNTPALVVSLTAVGLPDGDYRIELFEGNKMTPRQQSTLRLRSGDTVDPFSWEKCERLAYNVTEPESLGVFSASLFDEDWPCFVDGPLGVGETPRPRAAALPGVRPWWNGARPETGAAPAIETKVATPDPKSCVVTGAHYIELPLVLKGQKDKQIPGVCKYCGLVKRFPAWAPYQKKGEAAVAPTLSLDVSQLERVSTTAISWDSAVDGLMHVGGGQISSLEMLALQVEGSTLFVDEFLRSLEALGHLQVRRDHELRPASFEVAPSYVAQLVDGNHMLVGYWPPASRIRLRDAIEARGGSLRGVRPARGGVSVWTIERLSPESTQAAASEAVKEAVTVPDAASNVIRLLPKLSDFRAALPLWPMPAARRTARFHLESSSWSEVPTAMNAGAYRLQASFRSTYVHQNAAEARAGAARLGSAQLVKHLAALDEGRPLLAYEPEKKLLAVPLGADLPGLYGRALVLCSGRLPTPDPKQRTLIYRDVPLDVATTLNTIMSK